MKGALNLSKFTKIQIYFIPSVEAYYQFHILPYFLH